MLKTINEIVEIFKRKPVYLQNGAGKLARKFNTSIENVKAAKTICYSQGFTAKDNQTAKKGEGARVVERDSTPEGTISKIQSDSPLSPKEIEDLVKVDHLTSYVARVWDKQLPNGMWTYSVDIRFVKQALGVSEAFSKFLESAKFSYVVPKGQRKSIGDEFLVLSLSDLHVDKKSYLGEDEDMFQEAYKSACYLIERADRVSDFKELILILGNDFFNHDTYYNTTTKGTPQDSEGDYDQVFYKALTFTSDIVNMALIRGKKITVYSPAGNHDTTKSQFLQAALKKLYEKTVDVDIVLCAKDRQYFVRGNNLAMLTHGEKVKAKDIPTVFASEQAKEWHKPFKFVFKGHYHKDEETVYMATTESFGISVKTCPSLSKTDKWHYESGYIGNKRRSVAYLLSEKFGELDTFYTKSLGI